MDWFRSKQQSSSNELGDYLPSGEAQPYEQSERLRASSQPEADEKCDELASEYGGIEPDAKPIGKGLFDCKFKLWG